MLDLKLKDTHVLVTGGTKGIGRTILEKFLSEGANVSYCSRSATGNEYTSFLQSTHPTGSQPPASGSAVEIGDPAQVQEWVDSAAKKFGRIDTVVANGILTPQPYWPSALALSSRNCALRYQLPLRLGDVRTN